MEEEACTKVRCVRLFVQAWICIRSSRSCAPVGVYPIRICDGGREEERWGQLKREKWQTTKRSENHNDTHGPK